MTYIVLDFEFNQAYDFDSNTKGESNPKCRFEIMQIGAVKLNDNFEMVGSFNELIKPQIYKRIHPHVKKITGFDDSDFINCKNFVEVYNDFKEFIGEGSPLLCVWGNSDIRALYRNLTYYNLIKSPIIIQYVDVQSIATKYLNYSRGGAIGLKNAVDLLSIETEECYHNAYYDALYTSEVFKKVKTDNIQIKIFNSKRIN